MLTAKGQEEDIVLGLNLGADDYVTKPFRIAELVARVNAFVRRRNRDRAETHRFGGFELDSARHKLFRDGQEVELTPREFRLLAYFLERQGRALTREDILNSVWGHSIMVTERSVDRCITTLRAKIGAHYIETVRDVGYRFEVGSD
jgi:DNA-binding response OmpR family regulator